MLQVKQIKFDQNGVKIFAQGQSFLVRSGNGISMPVYSGIPLRYKGEFKALVVESDGSRHDYHIKISSIELRGVASAYIENNIAEFDDVTAIIYPPATLYKTVRV